jgi:hypothetical protein
VTHPRRADLHRLLPRTARGRSVVALAFFVALVTGIVVASGTAAYAVAGRRPARRVVIVLATDVYWDRIRLAPQDAPTLDYLLGRGTLANVVARRPLREGAKISVPSEAALTLSSGAWTTLAPGARAAYDATESIGGRSARLEYETIYGRSAGTAEVVYLGQRLAQQAQDKASMGAQIGALASSFEAAGAGAAGVGNADWGSSSARHLERPAGVAAANLEALVPSGQVGPGLLTSDPAAPYGVRTGEAAFASAFEAASARASSRSGASLIVLDAGDTFRVSRALSGGASPNPEWETLAISNLEQTVSLGLSGLAPDDLLMVISVPTRGSIRSPQGFGQVLLYGREFSGEAGWASSASTNRPGLVTLPDLSATAVDAAGITLPASFLGSRIEKTVAPGSLLARLQWLYIRDTAARAVLGVKYLVVTYYTLGIVLVAAVALLATWIWRAPRRLPGAALWLLEALLLVLASVPLAVWLAFAFDPLPQSGGAVLASLAWVILGVWLVAFLIRAFVNPRTALALVALATATMFVADQWLGAPLSFTTPLGYSPLEAARFYGLGNEGAALMISGGLVGLGVLFDQLGEFRARRLAPWVVPIVGGLLVATAVLPMAGANLGVAIWGTFAVVVATRLISRGRFTWRLVLVALAIAVSVAVAATWLDSLAGAQTHVGKAISSAGSSGIAALGTILVRKATASAFYLRSTPWIIVFIALYAWLLYGVFRPRGPHLWVSESDRSFTAAMKAILTTGIVAYVSEDSGIVMPIMLSIFTLIAFAYLSVVGAHRVPARTAAESDSRAEPGLPAVLDATDGEPV